jgi:hypothetical protein
MAEVAVPLNIYARRDGSAVRGKSCHQSYSKHCQQHYANTDVNISIEERREYCQHSDILADACARLGVMWVATPSLRRTRTVYSLPVSRRTTY